MSDTTQTISSIQPNLRFGTSFLDTKYRDRAALGETLMDKRTGEVVLRRKEDGSFLYFNREAPKIDDFIMQVASLIKTNVEFSYPNSNNREDISNIQFMTTLTDLQDFVKTPINANGGYSLGVTYMNNSNYEENKPKAITMTNEMNGFFLKIMSRPRDAAIVEFLSSIHDNYISNYSDNDPEILELKELYNKNELYRNGNVEIEYTVEAYDSNLTKVNEYTETTYIRLNQISLVPFFNAFVDHSAFSYLTLRINSVRLPKLKYALEFVNTSQYHDIYSALKDMSDGTIALTHMYISTFVEMNYNTKLADEVNSRVISSISLSSFENALRQIGNISSAGGIHVSSEIPDELILSRIEVWVERLREVKNKGETQNILDEPVTNMEELEYLFGEVECLKTYLTMNSNDNEGIFVGLKNSSGSFIPASPVSVKNVLPW